MRASLANQYIEELDLRRLLRVLPRGSIERSYILVQQHLQVAALLEREISVKTAGGASNTTDFIVLDFIDRFLAAAEASELLLPAQISCGTGYSPARVSLSLKRLAAAKLIDRPPAEAGDKRKLPVRLTAKGRKHAKNGSKRLEDLQSVLAEFLHPRVGDRSSRLLMTAAVLAKRVEAAEK